MKPLALLALAAGLYGCASSEGINEDTTVMEDTSMSETQTMAGDTDLTDENEAGVYAETATDVAAASEIDYSEMFSTVENTEQYDLVSLAKMDPNLTTFVMLVEQAGLANELMQGEAFTVFAPTNSAFAVLPQDSLNMLMKPENKAQLIKVLQAHVLPTKVGSASFNSSQRIETGGGEHVSVEVDDNSSYIAVGGARVVKPDVEASNGYIHVVDKIITPTEDVGRY